MSDEAVFLQAIQADPDDDTARLVYADWLDERGDVRGEFIRLQEEMKPLEVFSDRYYELKPRRNALRSQIDPGWIERLGYQPAYRPLFSKLPKNREHRWRLIEEFIDLWHEPSEAGRQLPESEVIALNSAEQRLGVPLPAALHEWYTRFGGVRRLWEVQDWWLAASDLHVDPKYDALIFRVENQHCALWGIDRRDLADRNPDPPVRIYIDGDGIQCDSISAFAALTLILESFWKAPVGAYAYDYDLPARDWLAEIREKLEPSELVSDYWFHKSLRVYEGLDLFVLATSSDDEYVYVGARTESAYLQLSDNLRADLERVERS